jgi:hypothetical protein
LAADAAPALALFLLGPVVYWRSLRPGWTIADGDLLFYFLPYRSSLAEAWRQGRWLPLWNPHIYLGAPFLANIQAGALYPPDLLLAVLPATVAIAWLIALHAGVAGAGMYLYAYRALGCGRVGGVVAGLVYMLGALFLSQVGHLNQENTLGWTPWLALAADRVAHKPTPRRLVALAVVGALVILAGHTQQAYFSFLLAAAAAGARLWRLCARRRLWRRAGRSTAFLGGAGALCVGLSALQVVATAEMTGLSARSGGLSLADAGSFSLRFTGFLGSFLPDYAADHPAEVSASVGAAVLPLIALALWARWRRPRIWIWVLLAVVSLAVAFGPKARVYDLFYAILPGFDLFRVPARALLFTTIAAAALAGHGARTAGQLALAWRRPPWRPRVASTVAGGALIAAVPAAAMTLELLGGNRPHGLLLVFPVLQLGNLALVVAFEAATLLVVLAGLAWRRMPAVLPAVVLADLLVLGSHTYALNPVPDSLARASQSTAALVPTGLDERYLALLPPGGASGSPPVAPTGLGEDDRTRYEGIYRIGESLTPNVSMLDGRLDADGYDGGILPLRSYVGFRTTLIPPGSANRPDYTDRLLTSQVWSPTWLRQAAVSTVVTDGRDPNAPGSTALVASGGRNGLVAWRLNEPLSRAHLADGRPAQVTADTGERVVVSLPTGATGTLVLADTYYPGWVATADGRPAAVEPYGAYGRAVRLPPGAREVVFEYRPRWLAPAAAVSLGSLVLALGLVLLPTLRREKQQLGDAVTRR